MTPAPRHSRKGLILPLAGLGLLLTLWTVWWFVLAGQVERQLASRAEALRDAGWTIRHGQTRVSGWPYRVRVDFPDAVVQAPSGHGLTATGLAAQAHAWNPDRWVVTAPGAVTLIRPDKGRVRIEGRVLRASASGLRRAMPNLALELVEPVFTPVATAEVFPIRAAERFELYARENARDPRNVDILVRLIDAQGRAGGPVEGLTQQGRLTLQLESTLTSARALRGMDAAGVFSEWTEAGGRFTAIEGEISAGESRARISSDALRADADGRLVGQVAFRAEQPLSAITGLAQSRSGAVNRIGAAGAAAAASATGDRDVALTVVFRDGRAWLGPFALAPAPRLF